LKVAIIGTGFAGFGSTTALSDDPDIEIEIFDIGLTSKLPAQPDYPVPNAKMHQGSFFTYGINDPRWSVDLDSKRICSSHALGGHSTVYSGAMLYPKETDLEEWPLESRPIAEDYQNVISQFNILSADDELQKEFPVIPDKDNLAKKHGPEDLAILGFSRIACELNSSSVNKKNNIFSTKSYFNNLLHQRKVKYWAPVFVIKIERIKNKLRILYENDKDDQNWSDEFDAVLLGAGCINTTGIVDRSLFREGTREYFLQSPVGLFSAFFRLKSSIEEDHRIRRIANFPEFFLEIKSKITSQTWSHTQITAINEQIILFISAKFPFFKNIISKFFNNYVYFASTILHSKFGKSTSLKICTVKSNTGKLQHSVCVKELDVTIETIKKYSFIHRAVIKNWKRLTMIPIPFGGLIADFLRENKLGGWHFGGTLPMSKSPRISQCYSSGEIKGLRGVYVIDSAAFPEIPGSTIALLISAHAHRVARQLKDNFLRNT